MSKVPLAIRPSDIDAFGHVNNAVYLAYVEQAWWQTLRSLPVADDLRSKPLRLASVSLDYRRPARLNETIAASVWLEDANPQRPLFGCEITGNGEGGGAEPQTLCRTVSSWSLAGADNRTWLPIPEKILAALPRERGALPAKFDLPGDNPEFKRYFWDHHVAFFEVGANGEVHPEAVLHWMQASVFDACAQAGWTSERRVAANFYVLQMRHDLEFLAYPRVDDTLRVVSRYLDSRRLRGTWLQEVRRSPGDELLVRDYSTGVFVDAQGRPSTPPAEMARDLHFGPQRI